jgi:hypothetical protein
MAAGRTTKERSLTWYLNKYNEIQDDILLLHRPTSEDFWNDRCLFLADGYSSHKAYNHRGILENEVVIEYDEKDPKENLRCAEEVCKRLKAHDIGYALWWSGNKSYHVHVFLDIKSATNPTALKRAFVRYVGTVDSPGNARTILPDLQLCGPNHLIRAENGVNEKTRKKKTLLRATRGYPELADVPAEVWAAYHEEMRKPRPAKSSKEIRAHPGFEYLLSTHRFIEAGDGHERALFLLIHALKEDYVGKDDEFIRYMQDWYRYSGGKNLTPAQIAHKVRYGLEKSYVVSVRMIDDLLASLGKQELTSTAKKEEAQS